MEITPVSGGLNMVGVRDPELVLEEINGKYFVFLLECFVSLRLQCK